MRSRKRIPVWRKDQQLHRLSDLMCRHCGQPMRPKGVPKRPNEYDHAQGCPARKEAPDAE